MIIASGRTFDYRRTLMLMGGRFDERARVWEFDRVTADQIAKLRGLVGVVITEREKPAPPPPMKPVTITDHRLAEILERVTIARDGPSASTLKPKVYGDDDTYLNYFAPQNPRAFFGFSSLGEFADYINRLPAHHATDPSRSGWSRDRSDWRGTKTMGDALDMARPRQPRRKHSLAGGAVSVGRMLAGDPMHMIRRAPQPGRRVITLFVEVGLSEEIDAATAIERAATIAATIDIMENQGYSCSLVVTDTSMHADKVYYQLAVKIKEAGERLNINDAVFALGHPSFLRRMSFAACSSADECKSIWYGQGSPRNAFNDKHPCGKNEYYFPVFRPETQRRLRSGEQMLDLIKPKGLEL